MSCTALLSLSSCQDVCAPFESIGDADQLAMLCGMKDEPCSLA